MQTETIEEQNIVTDSGEAITIQYNLVTIQIYDENEKNNNAYGVEIQKRKESRVMERDFVYAISEDRQKVLDMIHKLSENTVTPVSLISILNDYEGVMV